MNLVLVQIVLVSLVFLVGVYHLYLDQFTEPKSDIRVFTNPDQLDSGEFKQDRVNIHFELTANNRGDDNGYIDFGQIVRFEFSDTEMFSDPDRVEASTLSTPSDTDIPRLPRVSLEKDGEPTQVLVPQGEIVSFKGVCGIYTDDLQGVYSDYRAVRAVIDFQCRDNTREYTQRLTTDSIDILRIADASSRK